MFCTKCGAELPEGVKFCTSCGTPVKVLPGMEKVPVQPEPQPDTFVPAPEPVVPAQQAQKKKKKTVWPVVLICVLIALIAAAVCAVFFVPAVHDLVFGVEELSFTESKLQLCLGDKLDLTDTLDAGDRADSDLKWSSDDEEIATVKNGVVTAVAVGECRITVEDKKHDDVSDEIRVTVYEKVLGFREDEISLEIDETENLDSGNLYYDYLEFNELKWTSSDPDVASVTNMGIVTAEGSGTAVITVEADGMKASVTVTVEAEEPAVEPVDAAAEVAQIRSWYYSPAANDVRREVNSGDGGWSYAREYLYHDGEMVFAYLTDSNAQLRLYFKNGQLIFVIDTDRSEYSGDGLSRFQAIADQAKSDALNYAP